MEDIYLKIVETFKENESLFVEEELPVIRQIDLFLGQPNNEDFELFLPALFVGYHKSYLNVSKELTTLEFHVLQEIKKPSENYTSPTVLSLEYLGVLKMIKYFLNRLSGDSFSPLKFHSERQNITDWCIYHVLTYTTQSSAFVDSLQYAGMTELQLQPHVTGELKM